MVLKCYSQIFIYGNKALPVHFEISDRQIVQSIKQKEDNFTKNIHTGWLICEQVFSLQSDSDSLQSAFTYLTKPDLLCNSGSPFSHSSVCVAAVAILKVMCTLAGQLLLPRKICNSQVLPAFPLFDSESISKNCSVPDFHATYSYFYNICFLTCGFYGKKYILKVVFCYTRIDYFAK